MVSGPLAHPSGPRFRRPTHDTCTEVWDSEVKDELLLFIPTTMGTQKAALILHTFITTRCKPSPVDTVWCHRRVQAAREPAVMSAAETSLAERMCKTAAGIQPVLCLN